jgi:hypothetical protein
MEAISIEATPSLPLLQCGQYLRFLQRLLLLIDIFAPNSSYLAFSHPHHFSLLPWPDPNKKRKNRSLSGEVTYLIV